MRLTLLERYFVSWLFLLCSGCILHGHAFSSKLSTQQCRAQPPFLPSQAAPTQVAGRSRRISYDTKLHVDGQGMAGGNRHLLGDIIRALQPRYLSQVAEAVQSQVQGMPTVDVEAFCHHLQSQTDENGKPIIPTWQELEDLARPLQDEQMKANLSSAKATQRWFRSNQFPSIYITFYRDSAAWCPYCQKVWIALEELQIPYRVEKIDMRCYGQSKPTEYLHLQPNGNLPCAIVHYNPEDGDKKEVVLRESNDIIDALDELADKIYGSNRKTPRLRPDGEEDRIRNLCDNGRDSLERRLYARWMWWLTGVRRPQEYKDIFVEHWEEVEAALAETASEGPYFLGRNPSVVDLRFLPFVERQIASLTYFQGADYLRDAQRYPNIVKWLTTMESRPSYQATKSDYYTHSRALPPQLAADCITDTTIFPEKALDVQARIDSAPMGDGSLEWTEPGWEWYQQNPSHEAALQLIAGGIKIAAFASRGAGLVGLPAASAPLSDPAATPNSDLIPAMDLLFRFMANKLLRDSESPWFSGVLDLPSKSSTQEGIVMSLLQALDPKTAKAVADSLDYFRARIGVPRDLSYPAAKVLREELLRLSVPTREVSTPDKSTAIAM